MLIQNTASKVFKSDHRSFRDGRWTITQTETGYSLAIGYTRHEIHLEGLDGGSYTVSYISAAGTIRPYREAPLAENNPCVLSDVTVRGIIVTPQDLGPGAEPVLHLTSSEQMRGSGL